MMSSPMLQENFFTKLPKESLWNISSRLPPNERYKLASVSREINHRLFNLPKLPYDNLPTVSLLAQAMATAKTFVNIYTELTYDDRVIEEYHNYLEKGEIDIDSLHSTEPVFKHLRHLISIQQKLVKGMLYEVNQQPPLPHTDFGEISFSNLGYISLDKQMLAIEEIQQIIKKYYDKIKTNDCKHIYFLADNSESYVSGGQAYLLPSLGKTLSNEDIKKHLEVLSITRKLSETELVNLSISLSECTNLKVLSFENSRIKNYTAQILGNAIAEQAIKQRKNDVMEKLIGLSFKNTNLQDEGMANIIRCLPYTLTDFCIDINTTLCRDSSVSPNDLNPTSTNKPEPIGASTIEALTSYFNRPSSSFGMKAFSFLGYFVPDSISDEKLQKLAKAIVDKERDIPGIDINIQFGDKFHTFIDIARKKEQFLDIVLDNKRIAEDAMNKVSNIQKSVMKQSLIKSYTAETDYGKEVIMKELLVAAQTLTQNAIDAAQKAQDISKSLSFTCCAITANDYAKAASASASKAEEMLVEIRAIATFNDETLHMRHLSDDMYDHPGYKGPYEGISYSEPPVTPTLSDDDSDGDSDDDSPISSFPGNQ